MTDSAHRLITIKKAAQILGVTTLTLRNWDNAGKFTASRHPINNYRVYRSSDIEKLLLEIEISRGHKVTRSKVKKLLVQHLED
jgi:DNA-binding transcriptional MerR regulator